MLSWPPLQHAALGGRVPWVFCMCGEAGEWLVSQVNNSRSSNMAVAAGAGDGGGAEGQPSRASLPDLVEVFRRDVQSGLLTKLDVRLEFENVSAVWGLPGRGGHATQHSNSARSML